MEVEARQGLLRVFLKTVRLLKAPGLARIGDQRLDLTWGRPSRFLPANTLVGKLAESLRKFAAGGPAPARHSQSLK